MINLWKFVYGIIILNAVARIVLTDEQVQRIQQEAQEREMQNEQEWLYP